MKTCAYQLKLVLAVLLGLPPLSICFAANLSLSLSASSPSALDSAYPGSGSTVSTVIDNPTGIIATAFGRDYGPNPSPGSARWGVRAGPLPWRPSQTGIVVTSGHSPLAAGSSQNAGGTGASYVSITLSNVQPNTLFKNISIDFHGLTFTRTTNAWAASSVGGFTNWAAATANGSGSKLSVVLPDFTFAGGTSLEFRIYGIVSDSVGSFSGVLLNAKLSAAPLVPEPDGLILTAMGMAVIYGRRRRDA